MAEKFLRMTRTQTGDAGTFHAGRIYRETPKTAKALAAYLKRGFAEPITKKEIAALEAAGGVAGAAAAEAKEAEAKAAAEKAAAEKAAAEKEAAEKAAAEKAGE
ncbi:hypothetical protein [Mameliella alba]|uniref:Uncharacterized protein n=1 Tax=Mameliella alba TaxID=561184 RepID=A0A0B3RWX7_9RHOB|nr:hypothetical protein [Mameliella alba]KHQ51248.1 hypothetical protein OA50_04281 [Mameliella alba]